MGFKLQVYLKDTATPDYKDEIIKNNLPGCLMFIVMYLLRYLNLNNSFYLELIAH